MPLPHPAKSEIGTSYQVEFHEMMNTSARPENFEQLAKILRWMIPGKHNGVHGREGFSTTIDRFSDILNTVLKKNNGAVAASINPKSISIRRYPLKSCNSLGNSTVLGDRVQENTKIIRD
jgi:hypothetical protein